MEIDKAYLNEIYMGDVDYACEIFDLFMECGTEEVANIKQAFKNKSWLELKRFAHKIKPTMGMVGFPKLSETLAALEKAALAEDEEAVRDLLTSFLHDFREVRPKVKEMHKLLTAGNYSVFE
jgi:HPt (histidine-containing phosphotransfer) domain-containing protein